MQRVTNERTRRSAPGSWGGRRMQTVVVGVLATLTHALLVAFLVACGGAPPKIAWTNWDAEDRWCTTNIDACVRRCNDEHEASSGVEPTCDMLMVYRIEGSEPFASWSAARKLPTLEEESGILRFRSSEACKRGEVHACHAAQLLDDRLHDRLHLTHVAALIPGEDSVAPVSPMPLVRWPHLANSDADLYFETLGAKSASALADALAEPEGLSRFASLILKGKKLGGLAQATFADEPVERQGRLRGVALHAALDTYKEALASPLWNTREGCKVICAQKGWFLYFNALLLEQAGDRIGAQESACGDRCDRGRHETEVG